MGFNPSPFWTKKPQQVLAYTVSECWGHTNDATPEACWQVCYAGAGLDLRAADAHRWQILTPFEARPWADVLVITVCCFLTRAVWGIFTRLMPDPDVHLLTYKGKFDHHPVLFRDWSHSSGCCAHESAIRWIHPQPFCCFVWQGNLCCRNQSSQSLSEIHQLQEAAWTVMITVLNLLEKRGGFKKKKESSSKLLGHVLSLIAKVKWECDNDSADTEQLWEASRRRRFLDADTFLIQRPPSGSRVTIPLSENTFCPPWRPLVVTQNLDTWLYGWSQSLYV